MNDPTCAKCDREIEPGSAVVLVFDPDENGEPPRIFTDENMIIAHEKCPED